MNTASLARHYDALTPWERWPLLIAAEARADDVEHDRLAQSAPLTAGNDASRRARSFEIDTAADVARTLRETLNRHFGS